MCSESRSMARSLSSRSVAFSEERFKAAWSSLERSLFTSQTILDERLERCRRGNAFCRLAQRTSAKEAPKEVQECNQTFFSISWPPVTGLRNRMLMTPQVGQCSLFCGWARTSHCSADPKQTALRWFKLESYAQDMCGPATTGQNASPGRSVRTKCPLFPARELL